MSTKETLLQDIDLARCRGQWSSLPELLKKYKKIQTDDVLEITVSAEVELVTILNANKKSSDHETRGWDIIHQHDTPSHITMLPRLNPIQVQNLLKKLEALITRNKDDWQVQLSKILLARIYFETGQYENALLCLQKLALRAEDVQTGYGLVLLVQARAIKGMCFELQEDAEAAVEAYQAAWEVVSDHPQERGAMLSFWIEECLYRGTLARLKLNHSVKQTLDMMRGYFQLVSSHWSPHWRMFRRWIVLKNYTSYLVKTYENKTYIGPKDNTLPVEKAAFEELSTLMNLYRHLYTMILPYLTEQSKSFYALTLADILMHAHDVIGWGETSNIRRVLQYLYQVKAATFNNPTVTRYIFFTLMRLGSLEEAKLALRSYLESVGIPNVDAQIISNRNDYQNMDFGDSVTQAKSRLLESEETLALVLQVIATGIELYGHEDQNGPLAAFLSDLSIALLESDDEAVSEKESVKIYRLRGTAYSLLAIHSEEPKDRSQYHQESLQYLQKAITLDNTDWKSFYELGLQQAIMRDTHAAIVSCCKSIELNPQFSSSWHLLALLYSCKRSDSLSKALQTVEAGLKVSYYSKYLVDHTSSQGIPAFSWTENSTEHSASELFENAESYMSLRMSHITLVEASQGAEAAMKLYEELFVLYNQLTQQLGLTAQQQIVKDLEVSGPPDDTILPSDSASRKSSISAIRRASISSLTSSISRRRSSSVDEKRSPVPPTLVARKAESDTDEMSEDTEASSRRRKHHGRRRNSLRRKSSAATTEEMRKKSLQLVDLGMAKRIGTAAANPSQRNILNQVESTRSLALESTGNSAFSLASLLSPSYSRGSIRSNSISARSSSVIGSKDGHLASTFQQQHQTFEIRKRTRWQSVLVTLWLMSAQTFINANKIDDANKAIGEAEQLGLGDPGVWYYFGQLCLKARERLEEAPLKNQRAILEMTQVATDSFEKALTLDPEHVPSQVAKAVCLVQVGEWTLADGLLEQITRGSAWDSANAWYQHAKVAEHQDDLERKKTCLLYALELYDTEPIRNISVLPRFI